VAARFGVADIIVIVGRPAQQIETVGRDLDGRSGHALQANESLKAKNS